MELDKPIFKGHQEKYLYITENKYIFPLVIKNPIDFTMSFILRLQNLPWSANAMDIRNFFKGLAIPDGGVHIVGGEIGDAFIAFSNDEDARQAMLRDGGKIKEIQVRLLLSSRTEMQKVIDTARLATAQYSTLSKTSTAVATPAASIVLPAQIQPPVITSNLTSFVAKQVAAVIPPPGTTLSTQTIMQLKQQQTKLNALLMNTVTDTSNENKNDDRSSSEKDRKRDSDRRDRGYTSPRSRSRDRSKRSRSRSRSRDHLGRIRRRRSRSKERRIRRRSSSRERSRSRERNNRDVKKELPNPWAVNPNPATTIPIVNEILKMQQIDDLRMPATFLQGNTGLLLPDNAPLFTTSSSLNKPLIVTNNLITSSYDHKIVHNDKIEGRCVKIAKMDRITGYGEIRRFFNGLQIHQNGIKMINDKMGRRTGVAYIRFARLEFKRTALMQSGLTLRDAKVEITPLPDEDFDEATDSFKPRFDHYRRGGSYRSDDDDDDRDSDDDYYRKDRDRSRSRSRERGRDRNRNRSKHRDDSDDDDLQIISNTSRDNNSDNEDDIKVLPDSAKDSFTTLLIKDIPPFTKEQDIIKMFSNYTLVHILICKNVDGTKANYAYAKFHRAEDAKSALKEKTCHLIAYRNVTVSRVSDDIYDKDKNEINSDINLLDSELQTSTAKQQTNIIVPNYNMNIKDEIKQEHIMDKNTESTKPKIPLDPRLQKAQATPNAYLMNQFDNSCNNVWGQNMTQNTSPVWQMNMGNVGNSLMNANSDDSSVYQARKDPRLSRFDNANAAPTPSVQPWNNPVDLNPLNNFTNILSNNNNNVPLIRDPRQRNTGTTLYNNATSPPSMDDNTYNNMSNVQNYAQQSNVVHSVLLSNLELNTTDRDIIDFFSEVGLIPQRVHFLTNSNGMPNGDCFCEFSTPEEARRALHKNNYQIGMNSIKIELIPKSDNFEDRISNFQNESMGVRNESMGVRNESMGVRNESMGVRNETMGVRNESMGVRNEPMGVRNESMGVRNERRNNNWNINNNSNSSNSNNSNNYRERDRGGNDNFRDRMNNNSNNNSNNNMNNYRGNNSNFRGGNNNNSNNSMGRGYRGGNNNSMNRMNNNGNNNNNNKMNHPFNNNGGNNNSNSKPPSLLSLPAPPIGMSGGGPPFNNNGPVNNSPDFGKIGCVVSMENVPYRAGVDDILDFFNGFILDKQNIMRRYNDNGTPTGDARVCFVSPAEAQRAMELKKYGKIFNRTIYLKLLDDM